MILFQIVFLPIVCVLWGRSVRRLVHGERPRISAVLGVFVWLAGGIAIGFPNLTTKIAGLLGIGRGTDLVLYLTAVCFMASLLYFYQKCRRLDIAITRLVRAMALRDARQCDDSSNATEHREPEKRHA